MVTDNAEIGVKPVRQFYRRATDKSTLLRIYEILIKSDISFTLFVCGVLLPIWSVSQVFAMFTYEAFVANPRIAIDYYNISEIKFFITNHFFIGLAFIYVSIKNLPNPLTQLVSAWTFLIWIYVFASTSPVVTDKVLGIIFILLSVLMIQRSRNYAEKRNRQK